MGAEVTVSELKRLRARWSFEEARLRVIAEEASGAIDAPILDAEVKGYTSAIKTLDEATAADGFCPSKLAAQFKKAAHDLEAEAKIKGCADYWTIAGVAQGYWAATAELEAAIAGHQVPAPGTIWQEADMRSFAYR